MTRTGVVKFRDVSGALVPNPGERSYGCVIADFLGIDLPQIVVATVGGANHMYRFENGRFVDCAGPRFADTHRSAIGVAAADVDGSGRLALYFLNTDRFLGPESQPDALFLRVGPNTWRDIAMGHRTDGQPLIVPLNRAAGRSVCFADLTGNGWPDLYVANYGAPGLLYINRGRDPETGEWLGFANVAPPGRGIGCVTGGRGVVAADFFNSGRLDLFCTNENDANRFWRNDGVSDSGELTMVECAAALGLADPRQHGRGVAVGDFNRDGRLDIVYGNWEGPHRLMIQREDGTFEDRTPPEMKEPSRVRTVLTADFDNDGHLDIFFNNIGQPNRLFLNNGDGTFRPATPDEIALPEGEGTGASAGDFTGDGRIDLFISQGESTEQPNAAFMNDTENDHGWLRVLAQTRDGAPAVGARVEIVCDDGGDSRPQIRHIDGGSGYLCQMEPVAHFGLGRAPRVSRVKVRWTDGLERELSNVAINQSLVVRPA
ncbi:MAG: CRTAC1 family protein [Phycisphaerales bacterium]|nr:CRTAC1 family protein [Phycisphaerales bacterium]